MPLFNNNKRQPGAPYATKYENEPPKMAGAGLQAQVDYQFETRNLLREQNQQLGRIEALLERIARAAEVERRQVFEGPGR